MTSGSAADYEPSSGPDNSHLIYGRGDTTIYVTSLRGFGGTDTTTVVDRHNNGALFPRGAILGTISPDGQWVACSARDDTLGPIEIKVIPITGDTSKRRKLTKLSSGGQDWFPQWSPDGTYIIFERSTSATPKFALYRVRADGDSTQTAQAVYTNSQGKVTLYNAGNPSYSPDYALVLAAIGPSRTDSMVTHTFDPLLSVIPSFPNYAEPRFSSQDADTTFPTLGPLFSPDGTKLILVSKQVWATRRNMNLPPVFTNVDGAIKDTLAYKTKIVQCGNAVQFTLAATDPEGDQKT